MSSRNPKVKPLPQAQDTVQWPSLRTYLGAFRRQFLVAVIFSIPVAFLVLLGLALWPREYSSTAMMLFDPNQTRTEAQESSFVAANRMASTFTARFQDPEFLGRLAQGLDKKDEQEPIATGSTLKKYLGGVLPANLQPSSWSLTPEEMAEKLKIDALSEQIKVDSVPAQFQLSVVAKAEKPFEAQQLARQAMNLFVVEELNKQREKILSQIEQLKTLEKTMMREKNAPADVATTEPLAEAKSRLSVAERKQIKSREQALIAIILNKQAELVQALNNQVERQFQLESDLNNLQSRKGPAHPDVIQKRQEMDKFRSDPAVARLEGELRAQKLQLNQMQGQMRSKGVAVDRSVQISGFSDEVRRYLLDVSNQIRTLELESSHLKEQIDNPLKRTRFTTVREPELPTQTSDKKKFMAAAAVGILLIIGTFFMVIIVREVFSPYIYDRDMFKQQYDLPVVAEVKSSWQRRHRVFTSDVIRKLRSRLDQLGEQRNPALHMLDSYRFLQQFLLRQEPSPQVIVLLDLSAARSRYSLAGNLANVMATDSSEKVFLLSFRPKAHQELAGSGQADLMDFLAGKAEWKACRIKASDSFAFDAAIAQSPEEDVGAFRSDMVHKLIKALREKYQRIVVEGLGPGFIHENGSLCKEADSVVVQVGLGDTRKNDLDRILQVEDPGKVRAVILRT